MNLDRYRTLMADVEAGKNGKVGKAIQAGTIRWLLQPMAKGGRSPGGARPSGANFTGLRILVTGGSSGIGRAAAHRFAGLGAEVVVVARRIAELDRLCAEITESGGMAHAIACDLTDPESVTALAAEVRTRWSGMDVLVNNAGRSIRRSITDSLQRYEQGEPGDRRILHDFERTMAINYFGAVALTMQLLPAMLERGTGHIINVGTAGAHMGSMPRYSAYGGSKTALTAFGRSLGAELSSRGIAATTVQFPLVQTPMIDETEDYRGVPTLAPEAAAEWLVRAIRTRPIALYPRFAALMRAYSALFPTAADRALLMAS
ncbi:SDR family NAD(P)-dependent oxidoreductase [Nocardia sp. CWNU-33]|uniref:SDR family NAD(P)-dependent oxidoreductase n=1 Tax=Nocardia sp. CWNU-33 TaxID=3392117 RepID=UPI00398ED517